MPTLIINLASSMQPTASPLQASIDQLKGLPPALIIVDENDVLRDEVEAYAHKPIKADVGIKRLLSLHYPVTVGWVWK